LVPVSTSKPGPSTGKSTDEQVPPEKRRKEQQKFGIFYDDDYDYLQHLREPGRDQVFWEEVPHKHADEKAKAKIQLPSSVFASEFEENEGMLNKAVSSLDLLWQLLSSLIFLGSQKWPST
jgi:protein LTV1